MIEILIAISIIVTFSGLTGAVFAQIYEDTRISNAQLDLASIQEALVMYFTRNFRYPLELDELLERGDLNKVRVLQGCVPLCLSPYS
jgi:type II secretory pathway pseudopilin PulG